MTTPRVLWLIATLSGWSLPAAAQPLTPEQVVATSVAKNPRMSELRLTVREAQLDAQAQESLRPFTLRSDAGAQYDEQPSVGVIDTGVRETTAFRGSAELLKQFVIGTSLSFRIDLNRTISQIPFTVPDLNIEETRTIGPNWLASASVQAVQPLLRGRSPKVNELPRTLAQKQLDVAQLQRLQAANGLVADALDAYWRWIAAQLAYEARMESLERTKLLSDATLAQIEAGQLAELERDIVAQRIAAAEQTLVTAEAGVLDAAETLRKVMGESMGGAAQWQAPDGVVQDPPAIPEVAESLDAARRTSPEVALLEEQIEAARINTIRARDQTLPQLDAIATLAQLGLAEELGNALAQVGTLDYTGWFLGLNFAIPLDNGLARRTLEADEVAVLVAEVRRDDAMREIELRVRQARRLLETQKRRLEFSEREIGLARKNVAAMRAKFDAGLASYLEVLQLEEDLSGAEQRYNEARIDAITARVALQRITGTLLDSWRVELE